jgi:hypothetical protein
VKHLEERFLNQGVPERATVISDDFVWPTGSTLESYAFSQMVALALHYRKQLSSSNKNEDCQLCN